MTNAHINTIMGRLEDLTDMMVIHQQQGNHDMVALLDRQARELATMIDSGDELMTLTSL